MRILFVDDDEAILRALVDVCRHEGGFVTFTAGNADEARAVIDKELPDIVVSDQRMPGPTGIELFTHLRVNLPHIVRVLMTANANAEVRSTALVDGGVHAIIQKPWKLALLLGSLRSASAQARLRRIAAAAEAAAAKRAVRRPVSDDLSERFPPAPAPPSILIVDDDPGIREAIAGAMRDERYIVATAGNGKQALKMMRDGFRPTVMFLDLWMPEVDGFETLNALRADPKLAQVPVVVITAGAVVADKLDAGVRVMKKPLDLERLIAVVEDEGVRARAP